MNYMMDSVMMFFTALINRIYNCQAVSSTCDRYVQGIDLNDVIRNISFEGFTGPISYSGADRSCTSFPLSRVLKGSHVVSDLAI